MPSCLSRSRDEKRRFPPVELTVEDEERDPAEVIAMKMAQNNRVDRRVVEFEALHRRHRRCAAIDQQVEIAGAHRNAGVSPPATAERIPVKLKLSAVSEGFQFQHILLTRDISELQMN